MLKYFRKFARFVGDKHFNICKYMYNRIHLYRAYRWGLTTLAHLGIVIFTLFFCTVLGVGVTEFIGKYTIWTPIPNWYLKPLWGLLVLPWMLGIVVVIVGIICFFEDHIPTVRKRVRHKTTYFQYDMENEIRERQVRRERQEKEAARLAAKGPPKWEV